MASADEVGKCHKRSDSFGLLPPNMSELSLVLLGNSKSLMESVRDFLLGNKGFSLFTQYQKCIKVSGTFQDKPLTVIYTPDQLLSTTSQQKLQQFIQDIKDLSAPGPHVFLLLLQPENFTEEHKIRLQSVLERLSDQAFNHSLVLMFRPQKEKQGSKEKYMRQTHIRDMIIRCRDRYMWMDLTDLYKNDLDLKEFKRKALFSRICDILKGNRGDHLSPDSSEEEDSGLSQICGGGCLIFNPRDQQQVSELLESVETLRVKNEAHSFTTETLVQGQREKISALQKEQQERCDLRIILIGKTGAGKSSSGNTILGREEFYPKLSQRSVTRVCQKAESEIDGRHVSVVDTPGLFDTTTSGEEGNEERSRCISLLAPGPHVFLLVLQVGRLTPEEKETVELIKNGFGKEVDRFMIVLLTHGDKLENDDVTVEDYIENECDASFKELISNCANRKHVFNNRKKDDCSQVKELMKKIDALVKENGGDCYTKDMLLQAESPMNREIHKRLKEKDREREEMERKYKEEMNEMTMKLKMYEEKMKSAIERNMEQSKRQMEDERKKWGNERKRLENMFLERHEKQIRKMKAAYEEEERKQAEEFNEIKEMLEEKRMVESMQMRMSKKLDKILQQRQERRKELKEKEEKIRSNQS